MLYISPVEFVVFFVTRLLGRVYVVIALIKDFVICILTSRTLVDKS